MTAESPAPIDAPATQWVRGGTGSCRRRQGRGQLVSLAIGAGKAALRRLDGSATAERGPPDSGHDRRAGLEKSARARLSREPRQCTGGPAGNIETPMIPS